MKNLIILLLAIGVSYDAFSQSIELGTQSGQIRYLGDLAPEKSNVFNHYEHSFYQLYAEYRNNKNWSVKLSGTVGTVSGHDKNRVSSWQRNLHFKSAIRELDLTVQTFWPLFDLSFTPNKIELYGLIGVGVFQFNPKTRFQGRWVALQPLGTEGQGQEGMSPKYKLTQLNIPMGFGFNLPLSRQVTVGTEFSFRKLFTDYLDDISRNYPDAALYPSNDESPNTLNLSFRTNELMNEALPFPSETARGNADKQDSYWTMGIKIGYTFFSRKMGHVPRTGRLKCPKF